MNARSNRLSFTFCCRVRILTSGQKDLTASAAVSALLLPTCRFRNKNCLFRLLISIVSMSTCTHAIPYSDCNQKHLVHVFCELASCSTASVCYESCHNNSLKLALTMVTFLKPVITSVLMSSHPIPPAPMISTLAAATCRALRLSDPVRIPIDPQSQSYQHLVPTLGGEGVCRPCRCSHVACVKFKSALSGESTLLPFSANTS